MPKSREEVVESFGNRVKGFISYAWSDGYSSGYEKGQEEVKHLRAECTLEAGEHDEEYADNWRDYTTFYGWCKQCKKPHSGRWAHMWEYCPWCGAKVNTKAEKPYPLGLEHTPEKIQEILDMCKDVNPEEIKSHDTEESLKGWCGAWNRKMERLIKTVKEGLD